MWPGDTGRALTSCIHRGGEHTSGGFYAVSQIGSFLHDSDGRCKRSRKGWRVSLTSFLLSWEKNPTEIHTTLHLFTVFADHGIHMIVASIPVCMPVFLLEIGAVSRAEGYLSFLLYQAQVSP